MKLCARCLYPDTKPDLIFDAEGVCSACRSYEKRKLIDWKSRKGELEAILETGKNSSGYDCIVPSSGGKDSHWQVLKLIELGARPFVVTATTCHPTEIGKANIANLARFATTLEYTPNRVVRAKMNRIGLRLIGDISWPEHVVIFTTPFRFACDLGIPLIFYGECPQEAYGGPPGTDEAKEMTLRWVHEFGGFNGLRPSDMVGMEGISERDIVDYLPPPVDRVKAANVRAYFLGQFFEWDSRRNAAVAAVNGMRHQLPCDGAWWAFENLDNAQTGIHDYFMYLKYGYTRADAQLGVDIRSGSMLREAAVEMSRCSHALAFPEEYMDVSIQDILANIGMTVAEFDAIREQHKCSSAA